MDWSRVLSLEDAAEQEAIKQGRPWALLSVFERNCLCEKVKHDRASACAPAAYASLDPRTREFMGAASIAGIAPMPLGVVGGGMTRGTHDILQQQYRTGVGLREQAGMPSEQEQMEWAMSESTRGWRATDGEEGWRQQRQWVPGRGPASHSSDVATAAGPSSSHAAAATGPRNQGVRGARKALVIGISKYMPVAHELISAANDATDVGAKLRSMGFAVTITTDCDIHKLTHDKQEFISALRDGDEAVFYFAGHGVEWRESNWLVGQAIPQGNQWMDLQQYALDVQAILDDMEARGTRFALLILDCCREKAPQPPQAPTRGLTSSAGLREMQAPAGSYIAFACAPHRRAAEPLGQRNGIFTKHLLMHMGTPRLELDKLFIRVRNAVMQETSHSSFEEKQTPWSNSALTVEDACLQL